jgi:hypothetical protein
MQQRKSGNPAMTQAAAIDPFLDDDVRFRFALQIALAGVVAIVVLQGALDIDRVCVVPFDQVAVVASSWPAQDPREKPTGSRTSTMLKVRVEGEAGRVTRPLAGGRAFTEG